MRSPSAARSSATSRSSSTAATSIPRSTRRFSAASARWSRPGSARRQPMSSRASSSPARCRSTASTSSTRRSRCCAGRAARARRTGRSTPSGCTSIPRCRAARRDASSALLKAFALLNAWLRRQVAPDATRAFLGFADPFPQEYVHKLADPAYRPDLGALHRRLPRRQSDPEPRSRPLPLLTFLDEERVRALLPNEKIRQRPTFHYRLAGRAGERSRLEHRAGLEPLGRGRAPGLRPRPPRRDRRGLPRLRGRGQELGRHAPRGSPSDEPAADRRHDLAARRLAQLSDASPGAQTRRCAGDPARRRRRAADGRARRAGDRRRRRHRRRALRRPGAARRAHRPRARQARAPAPRRGACRAACRSSASAAARRCSTSRSAARCTPISTPSTSRRRGCAPCCRGRPSTSSRAAGSTASCAATRAG